MWSRLNRVKSWKALAEVANYRAPGLAQQCGVSLRQLERFLPSLTGMSPQRWLNQLRLQKAVELITLGHSVKVTAYRLGYKQPSHFTRQFKRFHGIAPTEFLARQISPRRSRIRHVARR